MFDQLVFSYRLSRKYLLNGVISPSSNTCFRLICLAEIDDRNQLDAPIARIDGYDLVPIDRMHLTGDAALILQFI